MLGSVSTALLMSACRQHFRRRLLTRVVSTLVLEVGNAHLAEEDVHKLHHVSDIFTAFGLFTNIVCSNLHETTERQVVVSNDTLDLMKFCQVGGIDCFVTEHTIDGEVTSWWRAAVRALLLR